jgi:hypothetical protein
MNSLNVTLCTICTLSCPNYLNCLVTGIAESCSKEQGHVEAQKCSSKNGENPHWEHQHSDAKLRSCNKLPISVVDTKHEGLVTPKDSLYNVAKELFQSLSDTKLRASHEVRDPREMAFVYGLKRIVTCTPDSSTR